MTYKDVLPAKQFGIAMFSVRGGLGKVTKKCAIKMNRDNHCQKVQMSKHVVSVVKLKVHYKDAQPAKKLDIVAVFVRREIGKVTEKTVSSLGYIRKRFIHVLNKIT